MSSSMPAAGRAAHGHRYADMWLDSLKATIDVGRFISGYVCFRNGQVQDVRVEAGAVRGRVSEGRIDEGRAVDGRDVEGRSAEGRAVEGRSAEGRDVEGRSAEGRAVDGRDVEGRGTSYEAVIRVTPYGVSEWDNVENLRLPDLDPVENLTPEQALAQLDRRFSYLGLQTFAQKLGSDVQAECTCSSYVSVCKHVAALSYAFEEMLRSNPIALVTLFGGKPERWRGARVRRQSTNVDEEGIPLVLLPPDAERNLKDRPIDDLVERYWRPIREIMPDDRILEPVDDFELPMKGSLNLSLNGSRDGSSEVVQVLEQMYAVIRERAAEIRRRVG